MLTNTAAALKHLSGSTEVGKQIMHSAAVSNVKKVSLELGGKSPLIIFSDADLEKAVRMAMGAVFFNKVTTICKPGDNSALT